MKRNTSKDSMEEVELNSGRVDNWTKEMEEALLLKRNICVTYKWLHNRMSTRYTMFHKVLENVVTFLQLIIGMSIFSSAFYCDQAFWVQIATSLVVVFTVFLARHHSTANYHHVAFRHKTAVSKWSGLYNEIDTQLRIPDENRQAAKNFAKWINQTFDRLLEASPDISPVVLKEYQKIFPNAAETHEIERRNIQIKIKESSTDERDEHIERAHYFHFDSNRNKYELDRYFVENVA